MAGSQEKATLAGAARLISRPERIVWAVAAHGGRRSICPLGWKMSCSGSPPMIAIAMAPSHVTHEFIELSGEYVLAWLGLEETSPRPRTSAAPAAGEPWTSSPRPGSRPCRPP